jgi:hypothetical protein
MDRDEVTADAKAVYSSLMELVAHACVVADGASG